MESLDAEPSRRKEFMTKRMNMTTADAEKDVTSRQKLLATQRNIPYDFRGSSCVVGLDFASIKDFASVGMLFKYGDEYWYKCKVNYITLDEKKGKEKKTPCYMYVQAGNPKDAEAVLTKGMQVIS